MGWEIDLLKLVLSTRFRFWYRKERARISISRLFDPDLPSLARRHEQSALRFTIEMGRDLSKPEEENNSFHDVVRAYEEDR